MFDSFQRKIRHGKKEKVCERNQAPTKPINAQVIQLQLATNDSAFTAGDDTLKGKNLIGSIWNTRKITRGGQSSSGRSN